MTANDDSAVAWANNLASQFNLGSVVGVQPITTGSQHSLQSWDMDVGGAIYRQAGQSFKAREHYGLSAADVYQMESAIYTELGSSADIPVPSWVHVGENRNRTFMVMERLPGAALNQNRHAALRAMGQWEAARLVRTCAQYAAAIHHLTYDLLTSRYGVTIPMGSFHLVPFQERSLAEVKAVAQRYAGFGLGDLAPLVDAWSRAMASAAEQAPLVLVHGDYYGGNILVSDGALPTVCGIIDFEMAHLGLPEEDLVWLLFRTLSVASRVDLWPTFIAAYEEAARTDADFTVRLEWRRVWLAARLIEHPQFQDDAVRMLREYLQT